MVFSLCLFFNSFLCLSLSLSFRFSFHFLFLSLPYEILDNICVIFIDPTTVQTALSDVVSRSTLLQAARAGALTGEFDFGNRRGSARALHVAINFYASATSVHVAIDSRAITRAVTNFRAKFRAHNTPREKQMLRISRNGSRSHDKLIVVLVRRQIGPAVFGLSWPSVQF